MVRIQGKLAICIALASGAALGATAEQEMALAPIPYPLQADSQYGKVLWGETGQDAPRRSWAG